MGHSVTQARETGADLPIVSGVSTRVRIEVHGDRARLYVLGQQQPTLIVNDVKTSAQAIG
jgi:hypothetical protein